MAWRDVRNRRQAARFGLAVTGLLLFVAALHLFRGRRKPPAWLPHARVWRRIFAVWYGAGEAGVLIEEAGVVYQELYPLRRHYGHFILRYHVAFQILPALAVYRVLLNRGMERGAALERVLTLVWGTIGGLYQRALFWLRYMPDPFAAWRNVVRVAMATIFPSAGWRRRPKADGWERYAFDIVGCVYLQTLTAFDAPELTTVFCRVDDRLAGLLPAGIQWERRGTLALGQECCDFCWRRVQGAMEKTGPSRQTS